MTPHVLPRFAAFLLPVVFGISGCTKAAEPVRDTGPTVAVTTFTTSQTDWPSHFDAGGALRARTTATIASRLLAPVINVRVRPGDRVAAGQSLIELDAAALGTEVTRASAAVIAATSGVTAAAADVTGAEAALTLARATHARIAQLKQDRAATAQELDEAVAARAAAESRLAAAHARHSEAAAGLDALKAAQQAATTGASYRTITAPFDGVVISRSIDPGSMAAPGAPLLVLESVNGLQLTLNIDAARAAFVRVGQSVDVRVDTDPADAPIHSGRVVEISNVDAGSHSFGVKIDLTDTAGWRSGLYGHARFTGSPRKAVVIPAAAVIRRGQLSFVFVATDARARLRAVSLGESGTSGVEVLDGLTAGESVLLNPPLTLSDGARITASAGAGR